MASPRTHAKDVCVVQRVATHVSSAASSLWAATTVTNKEWEAIGVPFAIVIVVRIAVVFVRFVKNTTVAVGCSTGTVRVDTI